MALQVNSALTTKSGFTVPSGSYVWLKEQRGTDRQYKVEVDIAFFKDKETFDLGRERFFPLELASDKYHFEQTFTPSAYASLTAMQVHNFVKAQLETALNISSGTITVVQ